MRIRRNGSTNFNVKIIGKSIILNVFFFSHLPRTKIIEWEMSTKYEALLPSEHQVISHVMFHADSTKGIIKKSIQ